MYELQRPKPKAQGGCLSVFNSMFKVIVILLVLICVALIIANIVIRQNRTRSVNLATVAEAGWLGWISGVDSCPESIEYGLLIAKIVNLYPTSDVNPLNRLGSILHGAKVEVLATDTKRGMTRVRYTDKIGYVQSLFVIGYDPTSGIQPDQGICY